MRSATALCAVFLCLSPAARADAPLGLDYTLTDCAELPDEPALEDGALTSCFAPPSGLAPNSGELTLYRDPVRDAYLAMILDRIPGHYQHRLRFFRFPTTMVGCAEITLLGEGRYIDLFPGTPDETNQDADAMSFPDLVPLDDGRVLVIRQDSTLHSLSFNGGAIAANRVTTRSALSALLRPEGFAASIAPLRHADALMAATLTPRSVTALAGGGFAALVITDVGRDVFTDVNLAWVVRVDAGGNSVVPASAHELGAGEHVTLAVVPGGTWTDPWDRALVPPLGDGDAEPGPDMGAEPIADAAPRGDDGCRGASTLAAHLTWVWLLVILRDRRRQRGRETH